LQLQRQKFDFIKKLNAIQEKGLIDIEKDNRAKIKCWGYFEKGSTYDTSQLDPRARTWFDIATADDLLVKIGYIKAGYLLRRKDLDTIVKELNLMEYGKKETEVKAVSTGHSQSAVPEVSVVTTGNEEFVQKVLTEDNPFPYPHPLEKPEFMVGGEEYLRWFENRYADARIPICFIVGVPGSGKSHFLSYLDYLFYRENRFRGLYLLYEAWREEISEKNVWTSLLFEKEEEKRQKLSARARDWSDEQALGLGLGVHKKISEKNSGPTA
jgi:hypothetical protein